MPDGLKVRNKSRKVMIGQSAPTELRATRQIMDGQVGQWHRKLSHYDNRDVHGCAEVLADLILQVELGYEDREVLESLLRRRPLLPALKQAKEIVERR